MLQALVGDLRPTKLTLTWSWSSSECLRVPYWDCQATTAIHSQCFPDPDDIHPPSSFAAACGSAYTSPTISSFAATCSFACTSLATSSCATICSLACPSPSTSSCAVACSAAYISPTTYSTPAITTTSCPAKSRSRGRTQTLASGCSDHELLVQIAGAQQQMAAVQQQALQQIAASQ
ncbi:hypothetical protein O3P69_018515 [Scylla paramamosain]|uniref:Uncharacterized protein n=1 Tax=Scylla paramamosain TaxID=85552 RepID=A0AAW0T542_SCYPA